LFFEGELKDAWRKKRMESKINELKSHYIICGAGDVGTTIINCFRDSEVNYVVVEENEKRVEELDKLGILVVLGNATHEDTLQKAGIKNAKGIVCTLPPDAENVFIVLTAKEMNDDIYIVSKAVEKSAHRKLLKAGANKTISPNEIGGQRMATLILRPAVISFLDVITRAGDVTLDLEEVVISSNSCLVGMKLFEAKIPEQTGLSILALKKKDSATFKFNPSSNEILNDGDTMVVLGAKEKVELVRTMVNIK
jgi:voltage-gated potassium channel